MPLKVAFQMDPIGAVDIDADSSFRLAEEAQARGHELFFYTPDKLAYQDGRVTARGHAMTVQRVRGDHVTLGPEAEVDLANWDVVWLRQDPPFDMGYITTTHILDRIHPATLVVNDPFWVRNYPEKLLVLQFPDLIPPTTIARDLAVLKAFRHQHGDMILKPLYGNGGAGVFKLDQTDRNLASLHEMFAGMNREPLIAQKFLPDVASGDKRVILVDGDPVGAINRVPQEGETRSNMHVGGRAEKAELTPRDREICTAIGPLLRDNGQIFVGIDVIGDYLTEINVTSPTGIQELERFDGTNIAGRIWDVIEAEAGGLMRLRLLNAYLRHIEKPWLARVAEPEEVRRGFARSARLVFRDPPFTATLPDRLDGIPALWTQVMPRRPGIIFYLHGGAYIMGNPATHRAMLARLAQMTGLRACLPQYRLAPEHPFPAGLDDAHRAWRALVARGYAPERIVMGGDSAGGGLMLALLARLLAEGTRPAAAFAMSPWTDMSLGGGSLVDNAEADPLLPVVQIKRAVSFYIGNRGPRDPGASPLFAAFPDAPPVFLQAARTEILRDDTLRMAQVLRAQGAAVTLDLWDDTPHVWPIFLGWLPEADAALARTAAFIAERLREPPPSGS